MIRPSRATAVDVAVAASAALLDLFLFSTISGPGTVGPDTWLATTVAVAGFVSLLLRRRYPVPVFVSVWLCSVLAAPVTGIDYRPTAMPAVALFTVALTSRSRVAASALVACAVLGVLASMLEANSQPPQERTVALFATLAFYQLLYGCVWAGARWMRMSRKHTSELEFRRRVEAQEAVLTERTRIARELHDIVAHSVTVMVLQAAGARRVLDADPALARRALCHIEESGAQAMGELRRMLTALRRNLQDEDAGTGQPQPGLADLPQLTETIAAAGVRVRTRVGGRPCPLAASVDLAVYRVVQEALTNVTKHVGPGTGVEVELAWEPGELTVTVTDDGRGSPPHPATLSTNHGLTGLRERLAIVGGRLDAAPVRDGGFRVSAVLPVTEQQRTDAREPG